MFQKYLELYLKVLSLFILIQGILIKFALDQNSNEELKRSLGWLGIIVCVLFAYGAFMAEYLVRKLKTRRQTACENLGVSTIHTFAAVHIASIGMTALNIAIAIAIISGVLMS